MSSLTNAELAILGLVAEQPKHGYQIEQEITARGMREWTEIGFSSIYYVLNKLEVSGWLASEVASEEVTGPAAGRLAGDRSPALPEAQPPKHEPRRGGPARRVYHLTGAGWGVYKEAVRARLANPRPRSGDFDLALANLPALPPGEARAALEVYRAALRQALESVQAKWSADQTAAGEYLPPHVAALFDHSTAALAAELAWVEKFLEGMSPISY